MRSRLISFGCYGAAVAITIVLLLLAGWCFGPYGSLLVFISIVMTLFDHEHAGFWRFETGLPGRSTALLALYLIFAWPIVFPWYLGFRFKIMSGTARLRDEYKPWKMSDAKIGPNGLLQPWRGKKL